MFDPYILGGVGIFHHNPEARAPNTLAAGSWFSLREIGTEGQNIELAEKYSNIQIALLGGFGVNFKVSERASIGLRFAYRKKFTDYLDDVGGNYVEKNLFENDFARQFSDRSLEATSITTGDVRNIERLQG
ncbi:MAG: hypothetical protein ACI81T_001227 [Bacteroidia bacterium]|jgi:hypothetical protein